MLLVSSLLAALAASPLRAENKLDEWGRLERVQLGKGWMPLQTDVRVPLKGWNKILSLGDCKSPAQYGAHARTWRAVLGNGDETTAEIEQTVQEEGGQLIYDIQATGKGTAETEGVFFWIDVPSEPFAGGKYKTDGWAPHPEPPKAGELPEKLPEEFRLCSTLTNKVVLTDATGKAEVVLELTPPAWILVQDGRKWGPHFSIVANVQTGHLAKGLSAKLQAKLYTRGEVEDTPAQLTLDPATVRYALTGIGGNYCFNIESPVTRYTLDNLKVAHARTEMTLEQWAPQDYGTDSAKPDWHLFAANDVPGSRLRREFELMGELSRKKVPYCCSIWRLPAWVYTKPPTKENMNNRIADDKWPQVLACISSYLLYAREKYAAEPDYFSFNEPNIGCRVAFNANEHRDAIKRIGAQLAKTGLKTRMLLGDVSGPRDTHNYIVPATEDPEAMKYVGALSAHSWCGATPAQYAAWADTAAKLRLPFIVAEAGPDPGAWQGGKYQSFGYGMREVEHYQELLLHARPQAVLLWEFTGDYSLLSVNRFDKTKLQLTERFCFQKHWCDLTPPGSEALGVKSDNDSILFTAFRGAAGGAKSYTLHLANLKWARRANLQGLPAELKTLNVVRTSRGELFKRQDAVSVADGKLSLELAAQSLTTLTTLDIPELKEP